jgi:hypothetical protein
MTSSGLSPAPQCVDAIMPAGPRLALEDFNNFALIVDVDGNGWSDRMRLLAHFNTPVLKQAGAALGCLTAVLRCRGLCAARIKPHRIQDTLPALLPSKLRGSHRSTVYPPPVPSCRTLNVLVTVHLPLLAARPPT